MPEITQLDELQAYWRERVTIEMDRLTLLTLIGAGVLSLKHPDFVGPSAALVRDALRQMVPLAYEHVPRQVLAEWDRVLGTALT